MGKIITVSSGKGGTGKTTSVAAISSCLASLGYKTLCIDFDAGMGNLDLALAMPEFSVLDYSDVLRGTVDLHAAINRCVLIEGLYFLSAPIDGNFTETDRPALEVMFARICESFDYCIIDAPPGIGTGFSLAHCCCDMSIIITTFEQPAVRDATRAAGELRALGIDDIRLLVNKVSKSKLKKIGTTIDDIIDDTGVRLIGLVADDRNIFRALHENTPLVLYKKRKAIYGFLDAARRITGEDIPLIWY